MATEIQSGEVEFQGKASKLKAYTAQPRAGGALGAVIVVQEWWGLNDHIRDVAGRLARQGYFAIAPDLYSRQGHKVTADPNVAGQLMQALNKNDGVDDLLSTVGWLRSQEKTRSSKLGVIGFCMGGSYALLLPCASRQISAAAVFYGEVPGEDRLKELACPILYVYGTNDQWIKRTDVDRLAATLKKLKKPGEVKIYEGCSHGFFNDTRPDVYAPKAAQDAWQRALDLFARNLKA